MKGIILSEAQEQEALFRWAAYESAAHPELKTLYHCPNGGSRNPREAANLKRQGVKAGVPDIFLPVPRGGFHGLYIELKRQDGGRVSQEQKEWLAALQEQGYMAVVCRGWIAAANTIRDYLGIGDAHGKNSEGD